jgi:hypothetical protein
MLGFVTSTQPTISAIPAERFGIALDNFQLQNFIYCKIPHILI